MSFVRVTHGETPADVFIVSQLDSENPTRLMNMHMTSPGTREAIVGATVDFTGDTLAAFITALQSIQALMADCDHRP